MSKKTTKFIKESGNEYVLQVKGNQPDLFKYLKQKTLVLKAIDCYSQKEISRGRREERTTKVYADHDALKGKGWFGIETIIKVHRKVKRKGHWSEETGYFISSMSPQVPAKVFHDGIREHWNIENSLHYCKDKTFREDDSRIRTGYSPQNLSLIRNIVLNIFRKNNYKNMAQATRLVAYDIKVMMNLILQA